MSEKRNPTSLHRKPLVTAITAILFTGSPLLATAQDQEERIDELEARLEAMAETLENRDGAGGSGFGDRFHFGSYGELHYNDLENDGDGDEFEQLDVHRLVFEAGYDFTDRMRFFSEVELEHALAGDEDNTGEVELEQMYIEYDLNNRHRAKGGVFLLPVGILNETHEPPTFYGVERNPVESNIIPTTWWAAGGLVSGQIGNSGFSYDAGIHEGLLTPDADIRSGRQKSAKANASNMAYTGRLKYTGIRGLEVATSFQYQGDISQDNDGSVDNPENAEEATLTSAHVVYERGPFGFRGLYAQWDVDGENLVSEQKTQEGGYVEVSYRFLDNVGAFVRQSKTEFWDGSKNDGMGGGVDVDQTSIGLNYWPHPDVVLKFDVQQETADNNENADDGFNLGIGYQI